MCACTCISINTGGVVSNQAEADDDASFKERLFMAVGETNNISLIFGSLHTHCHVRMQEFEISEIMTTIYSTIYACYSKP